MYVYLPVNVNILLTVHLQFLAFSCADMFCIICIPFSIIPVITKIVLIGIMIFVCERHG